MKLDLCLILGFFVVGISAQVGCQDYWDGTAPFCSGGPCRPGFIQKESSKCGGGGSCCWSGSKVHCVCGGGGAVGGPSCNPVPPQAFCWGAIKTCIDGCHSPWVCGACLGLGGSICWGCKRNDPFPRLSRPEVMAMADSLDSGSKRKSLFKFNFKQAETDPAEVVDATFHKVAETLMDNLHKVDPVASLKNWKLGPDYWVLKEEFRSGGNDTVGQLLGHP